MFKKIATTIFHFRNRRVLSKITYQYFTKRTKAIVSDVYLMTTLVLASFEFSMQRIVSRLAGM